MVILLSALILGWLNLYFSKKKHFFKNNLNLERETQPCHLQTWRRYILPFLTIWHHNLFHPCLLTVFAFDWSPLTVCLQQCEFAESQRWNRANTSSFFVILGKVLMHWAHFSLFSIFLWLSYVSFCTFVHFKGEKKNPTLLKEEFYLVKYEWRRGSRGVFNLSCLTVWLFIRLCTTVLFTHAFIREGGSPLNLLGRNYIQSVIRCYPIIPQMCDNI